MATLVIIGLSAVLLGCGFIIYMLYAECRSWEDHYESGMDQRDVTEAELRLKAEATLSEARDKWGQMAETLRESNRKLAEENQRLLTRDEKIKSIISIASAEISEIPAYPFPIHPFKFSEFVKEGQNENPL